MVRWRFVLILAMLMLSHVSCDEDDEQEDNPDEEENNDKDEEEEEPTEISQHVGRRAPVSTTLKATRTTKKLPLECFVCSYKKETPLLSCLDPSKYNVTTVTCQNQNEKCFTAVETKDSDVEMVVRGCRSTCVVAPDVSCCETNRCNNQLFAAPKPALRTLVHNKSYKSIPHSILFFVSILLILQTVVKVNIL